MSKRPALEPPLPWLSDSLRYSVFTPLSRMSTLSAEGARMTRVVLFFSSMQFS